MCGIFALIRCSATGICSRTVEYFNRIKHRGPDSSQIVIRNGVFLGFHRLAINDLTPKGDQPMLLDRTYLICNGEIYNAHELAEKYEFKMNSGSDCEILLHMVRKFGMQRTLSEVSGYFAFVMWNTETDHFYVARDPFGVRPLYYGINSEGDFCFSSELKAIMPGFVARQFPNAHYVWFHHENGARILRDLSKSESIDVSSIYTTPRFTFEKLARYYSFDYQPLEITLEDAMSRARNLLIRGVQRRISNTERPFGVLLSGGVDSSLVTGIVKSLIKTWPSKDGEERELHTFSIGVDVNAPDIVAARVVAKHVNSIHHEYIETEESMLEEIPHTVYYGETWDITTIRAMAMMLRLCRRIRNDPATTHITVLLSGEGADEAGGSYLYFHKAPSLDAFHNERVRLIDDLGHFDCQRADKAVAAFGFELRLPWLDKEFMDFYMRIPVEFMMPRDGVEKWFIRKAFDYDLIPKEILWRRKEAFSDGVSTTTRSWYSIIQEHCASTKVEPIEVEHCPPQTQEAHYYRRLYLDFYPEHDRVHPYYWLPKWSGEMTDPSARKLDVYT